MKINREYLLILLTLIALALTLTAGAAEEVVPEPVAPEAEAEGELDHALVTTPGLQLSSGCLTCVGNFNTGQLWEMGADCAAAATATENAAWAAANAHCQSLGALPNVACNFNFSVDACYDKMGGKVVDGHATYGCWEGEFFCPEV